MSFWTFENFQKWKNKVLGQGVIQRKTADGSNSTAGKFFKTFAGLSGLAETIFFQKVNIFTRRELIRIKI